MADPIFGTDGNDTLNDTDGNDTLLGLAGEDTSMKVQATIPSHLARVAGGHVCPKFSTTQLNIGLPSRPGHH